ncbi:caspase-8-like [Pseudomyrmex gracilis]|uniref:caspase-8-like n=1 Tax=Pseudomyrmex gracilis TaxID=219809 RepID=UPI000994909C|nr:caspase-8-like [Pseudomyrmex gracilis]XP_020287784.1 caspase-8-like [Pseudomyrmex gracilis]
MLSRDARNIDGSVVASTVVNMNILKQMENDLDMDEKISILFLMMEDYKNEDYISFIINLFQKSKLENNTYMITDFVKTYPKDWEDKLLEALSILNNREVIRKLGLSFENLELSYVPKVGMCVRNINVIAKCLYKVCESLSEEEQRQLLNCVKSEISNYESVLDNVNYLELHILYWIKIGYINITNKKYNMEKLLKHLHKFKDIKLKSLCLDLEKMSHPSHVVDTHKTFNTNNKNCQSLSSFEEPSDTEIQYKKRVRPINSGLCIVINQIHFRHEYKPRFGAEADCNNLRETLKDFGFRVVIFSDLVEEEMLEKIKNIPQEYGNKYDCLFLCILSHGCKGSIISADEKEVPLEAIEKAVCCIELKDVIKIVIIQACQGNTLGSKTKDLVKDGNGVIESPVYISSLENFYMFMSTIQGFASIRHTEQGSWFIQEVCKTLRTHGDQLPFSDCVREIMRSMRHKKGIMDGVLITQLSEIRQDRLLSDFQLKRVSNLSLK